MEIRIEGGALVRLPPRSFVARGGEGQVFAIGDAAYKIYDDPARTIALAKIAELGRIVEPRVRTPTARVLDATSGTPIGYAMRFVPDARALAQLVPSAAWRRTGMTMPHAIAIAARLRDVLAAVHAAGCCVVDLSPTNVLVQARDDEPALVDTDSWQTPGHAATAATPEIVDPRAPPGPCTPASDWFAFAVIAFELFVGIHPYKGKHPRIRGLFDRMRAGVTVLDPSVSVPPACRPIGDLPRAWRDWFHAVLTIGDRSPPPAAMRRVPARSANVARRVAAVAARLPDGTLLHVHVDEDAGVVRLADACGRVVMPASLALTPRDIVAIDGTVVMLVGDRLLRLDPCLVGDRIVVGSVAIANVMPHTCRLWPGVAIENVLGSTRALLVDPRGHVRALALPQLDGAAIVDARHDTGVLVVHVRTGARIDRWVVEWRGDGRSPEVRCRPDVERPGDPPQTISAHVGAPAARPRGRRQPTT